MDILSNPLNIKRCPIHAGIHVRLRRNARVSRLVIHNMESQRRYESISLSTQLTCKVYDRERQDKMYSPLAYVLGYRLSHLLTEGILSQ
jgi:hypothetical protein